MYLPEQLVAYNLWMTLEILSSMEHCGSSSKGRSDRILSRNELHQDKRYAILHWKTLHRASPLSFDKLEMQLYRTIDKVEQWYTKMNSMKHNTDRERHSLFYHYFHRHDLPSNEKQKHPLHEE